MAGLVTGDDGALSRDLQDRFVITGTTHITAVSGSNIALLVVAIVSLGGHYGWHRRLTWQIVVVLIIWGYALLVGLEAPAFRAALVATGAVSAVLFGRRPDLVTLTILAAALQLAVRPSDYWTLSFRLSFVSALALALVLRGQGAEGVRGWLRSAFFATLAAQIATTPLLLATFGRISVVALPANLIVAPLVDLAFPLALLTSLVVSVWAPLGEAIGQLAALPAGAIVELVDRLAEVPSAQLSGVQPGPVETVLVGLCCAGTIALMSIDARRVVRSAWRWSIAEPVPALAISMCTGLGCLLGLIVRVMR